MSEIPFVNQLGDALDAAIARQGVRRPSRWRRPAVYAVAAGLLVSGSAATASILSAPDRTTDGIACYTQLPLDNDQAVLASDDSRPPVAICAEALRSEGRTVPDLVPCSHDGGVAVVPGRAVAACERAGLAVLPAGFDEDRARFSQLETALLELEQRADCAAPAELAEEVQRVLDKQGWSGWSARVEANPGGPCGSVSTLDGAGRRSVSFAVAHDSARREVEISGTFARSVSDALFGPGRLVMKLNQRDRAGHGCAGHATLAAFAQRTFGEAGLRVRTLVGPMPAERKTGDLATSRYEAGCAIFPGVAPDPTDPRTVVVEIWERAE